MLTTLFNFLSKILNIFLWWKFVVNDLELQKFKFIKAKQQNFNIENKKCSLSRSKNDKTRIIIFLLGSI
jgi:hypothetical protein